MNHEFFLRRAINLAKQYSKSGKNGPFGAVIVQNKQIIGEGWNQVVSRTDPTAHAEIMAIRQACQNINSHDLKNSVIYSSCEPCPMCLAAIYWAHIPQLIYASDKKAAQKAGFDDDFIYQQIALSITQRQLASQQLLATEGIAVFQTWLDNPQRLPY